MASKAAHKRLTKEYLAIQRNPVEFCTVHPSERNILEWHYVITGPPQTPYEGGQYHGTLVFPSDYPFKPPAIRMITPSGRFQTNTRLCLSFSDFHPQSWNPSWMVSTIITGLISFMTSDELTTGGISCPAWERRRLALLSKEWNTKSDPRFVEEFPELAEQNQIELKEQAKRAAAEKQNQGTQSHPAVKSKSALDDSKNAARSSRFRYWVAGVFIFVCILARFAGSD